MPIPVRCPSCSKGLNVPEKYQGKSIKCPACQTGIKVPIKKKQAAKKKARPAAAVTAPAESDADFLANLNFDAPGAVDQSVQLCPKCATELPVDEVVCGKCGHNASTGMLDAAIAKKRMRKGPDSSEFYSIAVPDAWKFLKENFSYAKKTAIVWALFGTLSSIFAIVLSACNRGPTITFWTFLTGLATFAVAGWYWFLSETIVRVTMEKEDKIKRINIDTFVTLALGIKAVVWPFVMGLPVWIVVFAGLYFSGLEILDPPTIPALNANAANGEEVTDEDVAGAILQANSIPGMLARLRPTPAIVLGATYICLYMLFPIAQVHLTRKYTYKATVLWELFKVVPANFGGLAFWNLLAFALIGPIAGIFVLLELFGGGGNIFSNDYVTRAGTWFGNWLYNLIQGNEDSEAILFLLIRELTKALLCFIAMIVIAFLAAPPAVMLMRITGKFGLYNARNLSLVAKTHHGDPAGFWVRYVAFAIDLFCIPFAFLVAAREKAQSALSGLFTAVFFLSYIGYPEFLGAMFNLVVPMFLIVNAWVYYSVLESSTSRACIGKENMRLVAETEDGKQMSLGKASGHFLMSLITLPVFFLCGLDPEKKSLGDRMSKCRVVWRGDD